MRRDAVLAQGPRSDYELGPETLMPAFGRKQMMMGTPPSPRKCGASLGGNSIGGTGAFSSRLPEATAGRAGIMRQAHPAFSFLRRRVEGGVERHSPTARYYLR